MYWYQGKIYHQDTLELSISDPAFMYGANVFTTMRVYQQSLTHPLTNWVGHRDRLNHALTTFSWQPPDWDRLRQGVKSLIPDYPVIRILLFPDGRELVTGRYLPPDLIPHQQQGITGWLATEEIYQRPLANYKTGNYLVTYLALQQAKLQQAQEAILLDVQGNWVETATGNLWGYKDNCWYTPPLGGILPGMCRQLLMEHLSSVGIVAQELPWNIQLVKEFELIAYGNSVVEIIPFRHIIAHPPLDALHPALKVLRSFFSLEGA